MCCIEYTILPLTKDEKFCFFTIGYEGKLLENYLNFLMKNNIKILCVVRKNLISRKRGFSKGQLEKAVRNIDIEYIHMPELGIASEKRRNFKKIKIINVFLKTIKIQHLRTILMQ
ncbi:DUF488 family protein [Bartonella sp. AC90GZZY]|uniref:DUF488 family protein n=1 Tax=Bartonella sp. AC90GZZY TaxID=3243461 RepID=UPI0035D0B989